MKISSYRAAILVGIAVIATAGVVYLTFNKPVIIQSDACPATPYFGNPTTQAIYGNLVTSKVCRKAYVLLHDNDAKIPVWVAYNLTPKNSIGCVKRSDSFVADNTLPKGRRAEISDYARSGYDMGHIANGADMSWDPEVEKESYILSNMATQYPNFNRGIWKILESNIRSWAFNKGHPLTIYAGPIYNDTGRVIGKNSVRIPSAFYKIIVDDVTHESLAFVFPHVSDLGTNIEIYQTTVHEVEQTTSLSFPVTDNKFVRNPIWLPSTATFSQAKRIKCKN